MFEPLGAVGPAANSVTSLSFSFLIREGGMVRAFTFCVVEIHV